VGLNGSKHNPTGCSVICHIAVDDKNDNVECVVTLEAATSPNISYTSTNSILTGVPIFTTFSILSPLLVEVKTVCGGLESRI
jgi:hypothetical protein